MALTHALSTNNYGVARLIVATSAANGTHTTLASAMADAVSGDTIFLRDSVTENVSLTAGVNISAWSGSTLNTPTIIGTLTMTTAGTCTISGIRLQTNSAALLAITGSAASIVNLNNCYLNCTNNTGITFSSASTSASITLSKCTGDLGTTGIAYYTMSSTGLLRMFSCNFANTGASLTASSNSDGSVVVLNCSFNSVFSTSSSGTMSTYTSIFVTNAINTACITTAGTGMSNCQFCYFLSGTASALSIGSGTTLSLNNCNVASSNTNAITGAGTLASNATVMSGSSVKSNVTTQTGGGATGLTQGTAPSAGFIGERIESTATAVATTTATAKTITSVALTPGIWDVDALAYAQPTGGTAIMVEMVLGISTTDNTLTGTRGIEQSQIDVVTAGMQACSTVVPSYRVTLSANTTYYLVVKNTFTSTTCPTNARLSATRVG